MSESLSTVSQFFTTQSATTDVSSSVLASAWFFKIVTAIVAIIGMYAMGVFLLRIAVDILLIVLRGTKLAEGGMRKLGTGGGEKADGYNSAMGYIKSNIPEIILTIVLITFLITGWIFNLIAICINGVGMLLNKILHTDVIGNVSALSAQAYQENVGLLSPTQVKTQYDEATAQAKNYYNQIINNNTLNKSDDRMVTMRKNYTVQMEHAAILSKQAQSNDAAKVLNLDNNYFKTYTVNSNDGSSYCQTSLLDSTSQSYYGNSFKCASTYNALSAAKTKN